MADDFFSQFGGTAVGDTTAPPPTDDFFTQFGGTVAPHDDSAVSASVAPSADPGQAYLDGLNSGQIPFDASGSDAAKEAHYQAGKTFFDGNAPAQVVSGIGTGVKNFNFVNAIGKIGTALGDWDAKATTEVNRLADQHPLLGLPMAAGEAVAGAASGLGNLALQGRNLAQDTGNALDALDPDNAGKVEALGRERAYADYDQRLNAQRKATDDATISNALGAPGIYAAGQQAAPFLAPLPSLGLAGPVAKLSSAIGDAVEGGVNLAGKVAPYVAPAVGGIKGLAFGGPFGAYGGLLAGSRLGRGLAAAADSAAPLIGDTTAQLTGAGLNTAAGIGTNIAYGVAGAPAGDTANATEGAIAQGVIQSPLGILHGAGVRQDLNEAGLAKQAAVRGMTEYGNDPKLDNATSEGLAGLPPDQQQAILEQRGLYRDIQNPEGKQIQIHAPYDFAERAQAANGGQVDDAANARGYYLDGQGGVFINPAQADTLGALQEALGHEVGHSVYQDALPAVNARAATRLTNAVTDSALDSKLQPTPDFQNFINQYASAASGKPTEVDWNTLPTSGDGLTRNYLLNELGAETVRAAQPSVGKQLAGPEASDRISNFASDLATRLGLKQAPNATAILGADGAPVPVGVSPLQAARTGLYAIGAKARGELDSPIRVAQPDAVRTRPTPATGVSNPTQSTGNILDQLLSEQGTSSASVTPTAVAPQAQPIIAPIQPAANVGPNIAPITARNRVTIPPRPRLAPAGATPEVAARLTPATPQEAQGGAVPQQTPPADTQAEGPPVNRFAQEPPETGPTDREEVSTQTGQTPVPAAETNLPQNQGESQVSGQSIGENTSSGNAPENQPAREESQPQATEEKASSGDSTEEEPPAPINFTADDIARVKKETADNMVYLKENAKNGTKAEQLAKAQFKAVAAAHGEVAPNDGRVQYRVNPLTGQATLEGNFLANNDPFHQQFLDKLSSAARQNLRSVQSAIAANGDLNFDYHSADTAGTGVTGEGRKAAQKASTASDRAAGLGAIQEADKSKFPTGLSVSGDGNVIVKGFSPDKLIGNAKRVLDYMKDRGDRSLPFSDVNDPAFIQGYGDYARNQANGWKGDGSAPLKGTESIPVNPTPDYQPTPLPREQADFFNLVTQGSSESAKVTKGPYAPNGAAIREFATANGLTLDSATNEVNAMRARINASGDLQAPDGKGGQLQGTKQTLESPFGDDVRVDLMSNVKASTGQPPKMGEGGNLRAQALQTARGKLVEGGLPRSRQAAAGFLPARSAGATPEEAAEPIQQAHTPDDEPWPIDRQDILEYVDRNSPGEALNYRDLRDAIGRENYSLQTIPISKLKPSDYGEESSVDSSRATPSKGAIVVGPNGLIIDGRHRTQLAAKNGAKTIQAYLPDSLREKWLQ